MSSETSDPWRDVLDKVLFGSEIGMYGGVVPLDVIVRQRVRIDQTPEARPGRQLVDARSSVGSRDNR